MRVITPPNLISGYLDVEWEREERGRKAEERRGPGMDELELERYVLAYNTFHSSSASHTLTWQWGKES